MKVEGEPSPAKEFYRRIGALLEEHHLARASMTITPALRECLAGTLLFPVPEEDFQKVVGGQRAALDGQFWFGLPEAVPDEAVPLLQRCGALVIPAINTFRYPAHAHRELARRDVRRLLRAGVDGLQIDHVYRGVFDADR